MSTPLSNKSIVVIGGTTGPGLSAAKAFLAAGARIVVVGPDETLEAARSALGPRGLVVATEPADPKAALAAINVAVKNYGTLDGLYHAASASGRKHGDGPLHELTEEGWAWTIEQNLTALFYSNRAAVRQFLAQKTGGSVLNLSSVLGFAPAPHYFPTQAYAAAKAAILGFTRSAAACYAGAGIRFNVLAAGLLGAHAQAGPEFGAYIATKQPLDGGRPGQPADLDAAAVYFLSDASRFVTGQVLAVDGGWAVSEGQVASRAEPAAAPVQEIKKTLIRKLARWWVKTSQK